MTASARAAPSGWLRDPAFDLGFILGVLGLAIALGLAALVRPSLLPWVLAVDLWLLAYPHVASTFTRIAFDRASARNRFLLFVLPPLVLAATAGAAWLGGVVVLNTGYFYWQTWHYTRQSYGIARSYARSAGVNPSRRDVLSTVVVFAFPLWGLLHRAHQRPTVFYGAALYSPPVPKAVVLAAALIALTALAAWVVRRLRTATSLDTGHDLFILSHVAITVVSYVVVAEVTRGWLFINIWHNAQYLLFVWASNARRFRDGVDPERPVLSRLSQREHLGMYVLACLGVSTLFYFALAQATASLSSTLLPIVLVCHQAVNFHHYLVDAVIWRRASG